MIAIFWSTLRTLHNCSAYAQTNFPLKLLERKSLSQR